jgi:hypothetical protein
MVAILEIFFNMMTILLCVPTIRIYFGKSCHYPRAMSIQEKKREVHIKKVQRSGFWVPQLNSLRPG